MFLHIFLALPSCPQLEIINAGYEIEEKTSRDFQATCGSEVYEIQCLSSGTWSRQLPQCQGTS